MDIDWTEYHIDTEHHKENQYWTGHKIRVWTDKGSKTVYQDVPEPYQTWLRHMYDAGVRSVQQPLQQAIKEIHGLAGLQCKTWLED